MLPMLSFCARNIQKAMRIWGTDWIDTSVLNPEEEKVKERRIKKREKIKGNKKKKKKKERKSGKKNKERKRKGKDKEQKKREGNKSQCYVMCPTAINITAQTNWVTLLEPITLLVSLFLRVLSSPLFPPVFPVPSHTGYMSPPTCRDNTSTHTQL